jgi:lipopolysaccharide biosynthesis glycosyltransferase
MTFKIFIGVDDKELVAFQVAAHSIMARSSIPISIHPIYRKNLPFYTRPRGEYDSTDFSISRFLVPFLCDYQGHALFMDSDVLCLADIAEFANQCTIANSYGYSVQVVKHKYNPNPEAKFLGATQTLYGKKNWSSVMLFNNKMCQKLTLDYVQTASGLDLHQFAWTEDHRIRELASKWNVLIGEENQSEEAAIVHFTRGTPCFNGYDNQPYADLWWKEWSSMNSCGGGLARTA